MTWAVLVLAGLFEIGWAVGLKYTDGFTRLWPSVATAVALVLSMTLLGLAVRTLPLGTVPLGIVLFDEPASFARICCVGLILAGIIGLKLVTPGTS